MSDTSMNDTSMQPAAILVVFTTLPDVQSAHALADSLVAERLAACVSVLPAAHSVYRWQNNIEHATETPLMLKTTVARYAALEAALRARHPYATPEIIALPVTHGLPDYLAWVAAETHPEHQAENQPKNSPEDA
jgi:periplasmic divalent cation tolerance protein